MKKRDSSSRRIVVKKYESQCSAIQNDRLGDTSVPAESATLLGG